MGPDHYYHRPIVLQDVSQKTFIWKVFILKFRLYSFGESTQVMLCSPHSILSGGTLFQFVPLFMILNLIP